MLAHAIKISNAMFLKDNGDQQEALCRLTCNLLMTRTELWRSILVNGAPKNSDDRQLQKNLLDPVKELKEKYGSRNAAWVKVLRITVDNIADRNYNLFSDSIDFSSIEDPMFSNLKLVQDYS